MERVISYQYTELIESGFALIPQAIADKLRHIHFLTGTDPIYAGLTDWVEGKGGRSLRDMWGVYYPRHQIVEDRRTTIVMPDLMPEYPRELRPVMVAHELGHCLHEVVGLRYLARPVTEYAQVDMWEAFAEAFTLWLFPEYGRYYSIIDRVDDEMMALFSRLRDS